MINEYMESSFDINSDEFKQMAKINGEEWVAPRIGGADSFFEVGKVYTIGREKYRNKVFIRKETNGYTLLKGCQLANSPSNYNLKGGF